MASLADVFDAFGAWPVDAVKASDVLAAIGPAWLQRPETSRRVLQRVRLVFQWCIAQGFAQADPTVGITKVLPRHRRAPRHHAALQYREAPGFLTSLRAADASPPVKLALEFTILSAARTSEVLLATWDEIDLEERTWTIPASRMKARRTHRVPLSPRCVEILNAARQLSDGKGFVFPGRTGTAPLSNMAFLMVLRRLGRTDITTHGFRSSFRDWASEATNFPRVVCEAALAHTIRDKAEAAYHRTDLFDRRRELMIEWTTFACSEPAAI